MTHTASDRPGGGQAGPIPPTASAPMGLRRGTETLVSWTSTERAGLLPGRVHGGPVPAGPPGPRTGGEPRQQAHQSRPWTYLAAAAPAPLQGSWRDHRRARPVPPPTGPRPGNCSTACCPGRSRPDCPGSPSPRSAAPSPPSPTSSPVSCSPPARARSVSSRSSCSSAAGSSAPSWPWSVVTSVTGVSLCLGGYTVQITVPILALRSCGGCRRVARGIPRAAMSLAASGGRTVEPVTEEDF